MSHSLFAGGGSCFQYVKNTISVKLIKQKCNKTKYACISFRVIVKTRDKDGKVSGCLINDIRGYYSKYIIIRTNSRRIQVLGH